MLNSSEHEINPVYKSQIINNCKFFLFLPNIAKHDNFFANKYENLPTIVGIFIYISRKFFMLSRVEHAKSFITSRTCYEWGDFQQDPWGKRSVCRSPSHGEHVETQKLGPRVKILWHMEDSSAGNSERSKKEKKADEVMWGQHGFETGDSFRAAEDSKTWKRIIAIS